MHCSLAHFLSGLRILLEQFYTDFQHLVVQIISMLLKKVQTISQIIAFNRIQKLGGAAAPALSLKIS